MSHNFIKLPTQVAINDFLLTTARINHDGLVEYDPGWDDKKVAIHMSAELSVEINAHNVAHVRKEMLGKLISSPGSKGSGWKGALNEQDLRMDAIVRRINHIEVELGITNETPLKSAVTHGGNHVGRD